MAFDTYGLSGHEFPLIPWTRPCLSLVEDEWKFRQVTLSEKSAFLCL